MAEEMESGMLHTQDQVMAAIGTNQAANSGKWVLMACGAMFPLPCQATLVSRIVLVADYRD